jgi:hypothetical protein
MNTELKYKPTTKTPRDRRRRAIWIAFAVVSVLLAAWILWDLNNLERQRSSVPGAAVAPTVPPRAPMNDAPGTNTPAPESAGNPADTQQSTGQPNDGTKMQAGNTGISTATDAIGGATVGKKKAEPQDVYNSQMNQEYKR